MSTSCNCGAEWTGKRIEHCTACHETFTGTTPGDMHRTGDHAVSRGLNRRRCLTIAEMLAKGMRQNDRRHWTSGGGFWGHQSTQERREGSPEGDGRGASVPGAESEGER